MLTLAEVRDWLKSYEIAQHYFVGKLDTSKENALCVYNRKRSGAPVMALGGVSSYDIKSVSLLLHCSKNAVQAEKTAITLFEKLRAERELKINGVPIYYISMQVPEPVAVGTDDNGVYEYVIEFDLYYEKGMINNG
jgi:hypothetical protein